MTPGESSSSDLVVRELSDNDTHAWTAFAEAHPDANLYHTLEWRDAVREIFGHEPRYLVGEFDGVIRGVLPLFLIKFPLLGSKLISIPYDIGSGGALAVDDRAERALLESAVATARKINVDFLQLRYGSRRDVASSLGLQPSEPVLISEMQLDSEEKVWSRVSKDHRKAVRKAKNRGVVIREAKDLEDVGEFYRIYLKAFREFGTPPYGSNYFPSIWRHFHGSGAMRLLLAHADDKCVGGLLLFCWGKNIVSKFAACLPEAVPMRAYAALYWRAIQIGLESGYKKLSWGTSSKSQGGLIEFKERWGADTRPAVIYSLSVKKDAPSIENYYDSGGLIRRVWSRLPIGATRLLGGTLNKWFC